VPVLLVLLALTGCGGTSPSSQESSSASEESVASPTEEPSATPTEAPSTGPVDIGDRSLFLDCRGAGSPTVILEAGLTGDSRTWENVMPEIEAQTRVCAYDRANVGQSDPAPPGRTTQDMVDDLQAVLEGAGEQPPYVLVGFSFGGLVSQLYASTYPEQVAGVVLVESMHAQEAKRSEAHLTPQQIEEDRAFVEDNPEGVDVYGSLNEVQAARGLPDVPLVVVSAAHSDGWPPGWDTKLFDRLRAELQADLAGLTPSGEQVIAENSGHHVPAQELGVIVEAIKTVLKRAG
jgi:pimeloyl-ACP methyl ester carboxylesterase